MGEHLVRVQDTIPIHAAIVSQRLATAALRGGSRWVAKQVKVLGGNRWASCPTHIVPGPSAVVHLTPAAGTPSE